MPDKMLPGPNRKYNTRNAPPQSSRRRVADLIDKTAESEKSASSKLLEALSKAQKKPSPPKEESASASSSKQKTVTIAAAQPKQSKRKKSESSGPPPALAAAATLPPSTSTRRSRGGSVAARMSRQANKIQSSKNPVKPSTSKVQKIPEDVLDDLCFRFITNVPEEAKCDTIRVCFQVELAHWFYCDFYINQEFRKDCPQLGMKEFARQLFASSHEMEEYSHCSDEVIDEWRTYKSTVPTYGAILMDETLNNCVLVQGYYASKNSWGFPKGKINEAEDPRRCAIREVFEETGFDFGEHSLRKEFKIQKFINDSMIRLYVVTGVPMDYKFTPQTRNEIREIKWFNIWELPTHKDDLQIARAVSNNNFYMAMPFIQDLQNYVKREYKAGRYGAALRSVPSANQATFDPSNPLQQTTTPKFAPTATNSNPAEVSSVLSALFSGAPITPQASHTSTSQSGLLTGPPSSFPLSTNSAKDSTKVSNEQKELDYFNKTNNSIPMPVRPPPVSLHSHPLPTSKKPFSPVVGSAPIINHLSTGAAPKSSPSFVGSSSLSGVPMPDPSSLSSAATFAGTSPLKTYATSAGQPMVPTPPLTNYNQLTLQQLQQLAGIQMPLLASHAHSMTEPTPSITGQYTGGSMVGRGQNLQMNTMMQQQQQQQQQQSSLPIHQPMTIQTMNQQMMSSNAMNSPFSALSPPVSQQSHFRPVGSTAQDGRTIMHMLHESGVAPPSRNAPKPRLAHPIPRQPFTQPEQLSGLPRNSPGKNNRLSLSETSAFTALPSKNTPSSNKSTPPSRIVQKASTPSSNETISVLEIERELHKLLAGGTSARDSEIEGEEDTTPTPSFHDFQSTYSSTMDLSSEFRYPPAVGLDVTNGRYQYIANRLGHSGTPELIKECDAWNNFKFHIDPSDIFKGLQ